MKKERDVVEINKKVFLASIICIVISLILFATLAINREINFSPYEDSIMCQSAENGTVVMIDVYGINKTAVCCSHQAIDLENDQYNCGSCGHRCYGSRMCKAGICS